MKQTLVTTDNVWKRAFKTIAYTTDSWIRQIRNRTNNIIQKLFLLHCDSYSLEIVCRRTSGSCVLIQVTFVCLISDSHGGWNEGDERSPFVGQSNIWVRFWSNFLVHKIDFTRVICGCLDFSMLVNCIRPASEPLLHFVHIVLSWPSYECDAAVMHLGPKAQRPCDPPFSKWCWSTVLSFLLFCCSSVMSEQLLKF